MLDGRHCHGDHVVHVQEPVWVPKFVFLDTETCPHVMQEHYWRYSDTDTYFVLRQCSVALKETLNFKRFPFDRQMLTAAFESHNCRIVTYPERVLGFEPDCFKSKPMVEVQLHSAAHLWRLHDASVFAQTNGEGLTQVVAKVFVEREATYYELNIGIILYFIVLAALCSVGIPFDSSQDRFALVVTLMLTSVAFKFVTHEMTPNTPYLTLLDKFMLVGMLTLVGVLAKDFVFALKYQARDGDGDDDDALQDLDQLIVGVTASEKSSNPTNVCG